MALQDIGVVYGLPDTFLTTKHFLAETKRVQGFSDSLTRGLAVSGEGGSAVTLTGQNLQFFGLVLRQFT